VTHELRVSPDEPIAAGDERASTGPRRRRHLTAMGVLEVLMWCAGAGALVAFWLWSRPTDVPGFGKATLERARPPVVLPGATATAQPNANLEVWQERFRAATTTAVQDHEPDPLSTGSASPAPPVTQSLDSSNTGLMLAQSGGGAADGPADFAAGNEITLQDGPVNIDPSRTQLAESEVSPAELDDRSSAPAEDAAFESSRLIEAEISLPSQPLPLEMLGFAAVEPVSSIPDELVLQFASDPGLAVAGRDVIIVVEAEPPQVTVPEVQIALADITAISSRDASGPQIEISEQRSESASRLNAVDRDFIVRRGEELLAQGDLAGARLFFGRAAADGDPRGATGMARSFDPETLRKLRVLGIRPDPDQAAQWYARSKLLQAVASTR
jgi:hypothetical protein